MPRPPRFVIPGLPQQAIVRDNNRDAICSAEKGYSTGLDW